ncbi:MAG: biopolymer transporter ExbD [Gemmatimonadales bacterium]
MATSASNAVPIKGGAKADINVTPMVDVMLVLLIIFMIVTPAITAGFQATMPKGHNPDARPEEPDEIRLGIDKDGNYFLDISQTAETAVPPGLEQLAGKGPRPIAAADVPNALSVLFCARTKDRVLFLKAHHELEFGRIQDAMELARKNCVRVIAAITEQLQSMEFGRRQEN